MRSANFYHHRKLRHSAAALRRRRAALPHLILTTVVAQGFCKVRRGIRSILRSCWSHWKLLFSGGKAHNSITIRELHALHLSVKTKHFGNVSRSDVNTLHNASFRDVLFYVETHTGSPGKDSNGSFRFIGKDLTYEQLHGISR